MAKKRPSLTSSSWKTAPSPQPQRRLPGWVWLMMGGLLAVLLVLGLFYLGQQGVAQVNIEDLVVFPNPGAGHQEGDINYAEDMPVGGLHNPAWQNCGIYDQPIRTENVIHSLEHGAVWIAYQPDLPTSQVDILRNLVRQASLVILAPRPGLADAIVATAWRVQLPLTDAADERLPLFLKRYQRGPYAPEPGAPCAGGVGTPLS